MESLLADRSLIVIAGLDPCAARLSVFVGRRCASSTWSSKSRPRIWALRRGSVALTVSLPLAWPALVYSGVLIFFLGFELFGLPLIIGDAANVLVLTTYLFKLTNILGTPSYQLMAVVVVAIALVTLAAGLLCSATCCRWPSATSPMGGKGHPGRGALRLGRWRWVALARIVLWLIVAIGLPLGGVLLRAFVSRWGEGINPFETLTLQNFRRSRRVSEPASAASSTPSCWRPWARPPRSRSTPLIALATHRWPSRLVAHGRLSRAAAAVAAGLVAGLAFLWVFLFVPYLGATAQLAGRALARLQRRRGSPSGCGSFRRP